MQNYSLLENKKVAVLGGGITGRAVVKFLSKQNIKEVVLFDENDLDSNSLKNFEELNCKIYQKNNGQDAIKDFDLLITSPSFKQDHPTVAKAKELQIPVYNDVKLFLELLENKKAVIGVTGSNGKSTTVSLIYHILKSSGKKVFLAGNIGTSPLDYLGEEDHETYFVLELSSYQLEMFGDKNYFDYTVITNITQNHLERYGGSFDKYADAKCVINTKETKATIINLDDPLISKYQKKICGKEIYTVSLINPVTEISRNTIHLTDSNVLTFFDKKGESTEIDVRDKKIIGVHNLYNIAYASIISLLNGLNVEEIKEALKTFEGLEHRIEFVCKKDNVVWINDSKSTSPDALQTAFDAVESDRVVLIAGGKEKDFNYKSVLENINHKVVGMVLLPGSGSERFANEFEKLNDITIVKVKNMDEAVKSAIIMSKDADTVLLSPCLPSDAPFKEFEERGRAFKDSVKKFVCS